MLYQKIGSTKSKSGQIVDTQLKPEEIKNSLKIHHDYMMLTKSGKLIVLASVIIKNSVPNRMTILEVDQENEKSSNDDIGKNDDEP